MSFVTWGLFWGGLAAVSAPILIHILNRQKYKRVRWAAMEFLLLAFKRTRRRIQIEHLIILLLRCLALLMLGACLAQPLLGGFIVSGNRDVYVLVDDSYSMGYLDAESETCFMRAQKSLKDVLHSLKPEDNLRVILLSDIMKKAYPEDDSGRERRVIPVFQGIGGSLTQQDIDQFTADVTKKLQPSDFNTDLYAGIQHMYRMIYSGVNKEQPTKELYIITDFQRNSWGLGGGQKDKTDEVEEDEEGERFTAAGTASRKEFKKLLGDLTEPHAGVEVKVFLVDVGDREQKKENFIIKGISVDQKELVTGSYANFEVAVRNVGFETRNANVKLYIDDSSSPVAGKTISMLEPGETGKISFRRTFTDGEEGAHWVKAVIEDNLVTDSAFYMGFKVRKGINVLIIDGDKKPDFKSESWFLQFALHPQGIDEIQSPTEKKLYILRPTVVDRLLSERDTQRRRYFNYDVVIMANVKITPTSPTDGEIEMLKTYVQNGGKLVIWLGDNVDGNEYNQRLFGDGEGLMPAELARMPKGEKYSDIADLPHKTEFYAGELAHPIMRIFVNSKVLEREDTKPGFSKYFPLKVPPANQVIARFDASNTFSDYKVEKLPAIVVKRFSNNGRVVLVNTTADGDWNNMTVSPKDAVYLILVHQIVTYLIGMEQTGIPLGQSIERSYLLPDGSRKDYIYIKGPNDPKPSVVLDVKEEDLPDQRKVIFHATVRDTFTAGPYMLQYFESSELKDCYAANVNLSESNLTRIEPANLKGIYPEFKVHRIVEPEKKIKVEGVNLSSNIWRIPLALMMLFLALESGLALLFGRRSGA